MTVLKIIYIKLFVIISIVFLPEAQSYHYETHFFKQKVDHFGYSNQDYFLQRYLMADLYWNKTEGPIFFYTGNEGDITMFANNTGLMWELAPKFQALLIFAEHRYYGISLPYGKESFLSFQNRGYLTSEQALADYAELIYYLREMLHLRPIHAVIVFGGSYGGMLAAWMRMKYPHIVDGAVASSAPVFQFPNLTDCEKFAGIVTTDFARTSIQCVRSIRKSWKIIKSYGNTTYGTKWLSSTFHLCNELKVTHLNKFIDWISGTWEYLAMTDYPYPTNFLVPLPAYPINETCSYLKNSDEPEDLLMFHLFQALSVFHNFSGSARCFNLSVSSGPSLGDVGWSYQSCTEMVMPTCTNGVSDMFEPSAWNFEAYSENCYKQWSVRPDPKKAVIMYGGKNISAASNIFFSNGKLDPWSAGGVLNSVSETLIAYVIENAAHHLDLRSSNSADPKSVIKARNSEMDFIKKCIKKLV